MYKIVLIDDEKKIQNSLKQIIENYAEDVEISGLAFDVKSGIEIINNVSPDIVFLDIEMPDGNGFDLLNQLNNTKFSLIFCTGHNGFAIKAFKYNAIDYVLKPFDIEDVTAAIEKAKKDLKLKQKDISIDSLLSFYKNSQKKESKLILKTATDIYVVQINDIYNCQSEGSYTIFKFENEKTITVSKPLKEYEDILVSHNFIKTHQSHLVNIVHIERFHKKDGAFLILKNGREIPISVRKKEAVILAIENMNS